MWVESDQSITNTYILYHCQPTGHWVAYCLKLLVCTSATLEIVSSFTIVLSCMVSVLLSFIIMVCGFGTSMMVVKGVYVRMTGLVYQDIVVVDQTLIRG